MRLNAKNNWRHTWKSLPKYHADGSAIEWRVTEQPLKRYTVRISRDGNTFLVVNTYNPQSPDEDSTTRTVIKRWDDAGYEQKPGIGWTAQELPFRDLGKGKQNRRMQRQVPCNPPKTMLH